MPDHFNTKPVHTAADLAETLYRGLADNSVGRVIDTLLRNDLILIDLCRHRNYAEPQRVNVFIPQETGALLSA